MDVKSLRGQLFGWFLKQLGFLVLFIPAAGMSVSTKATKLGIHCQHRIGPNLFPSRKPTYNFCSHIWLDNVQEEGWIKSES